MPTSLEKKYFDVLQNIEFAIVQTYREQPDLTDAQVDNVLNGLIRVYRAEESGREPPRVKLSELEKALFGGTKAMCDWRLGRESMVKVDKKGREEAVTVDPIEMSEIVACLKRLRRSVSLWSKRGGRQGYLTVVSPI